ncbi:MAG: AAA family ATPase, partial [Bacteroidota bacterium]
MSTTTPLLNEENLRRELDWLEKCLSARIAQELAIPEPPVLHPDTAFSNTIDQHELEVPERLFLALAIATEIRPDMLHDIAQQSSMAPALGLRIHQATRTFRPTFRTAVFLVAGPATARFVAISKRFCLENVLFKVRILEAGGHHEAGGVHGRTFQLHPAAWQEIIYGTPFQPRISTDFPAELLTTKMEWKDLILGESTRKQVEEIHVWLRNTQKFAKDEILRTRLKPGYRALFHGPPGTGKTLTATLLGKATGRDVYRVDLSQIVSKYIGETEKNLRRIFDLAETRDWILFFDEADSLFGKRGKVNDAR